MFNQVHPGTHRDEPINFIAMRAFIFSILLLVSSYWGYSQDYKVMWQQCLGDEESAYHYSVTKISDGFFLTLGINSGEGVTNYHGSADIWVIRTDSLHNVLWEKCYGGSDTDNPREIVPITDSTFYIFGSTWSVDGDVQSGTYGFNDVWVIKINGQGDILWERTYGTPYYEDMNDLVVTPDGGFVFIDRIGSAGGDVSQYYGQYDVWMCKCDSEGNIEWEKTLGNEGLDNGVSLMMNSSGNIVMIGAVQWHGGMVTCYPQGEIGNVWLIELDMQGNILWQNCYGGTYYEAGYKVTEVNDGYIFVALSKSNDGDVTGHHGPGGESTNPDIWVVKTDTLGEIVWQKSIGGTDREYSSAIFTNSAGEILIFGETASDDGDVSGNHSNPEWIDVWFAKLDANGTLLGQQCFGGRSNEYLNTHSVAKIDDYRYIIASETGYSDGDVNCTILESDIDAWFFEIKDCDYYAPAIPSQPQGPAWVYTSVTSQSDYTLPAAANSNGYVWELSPSAAGTLSFENTSAIVTWNSTFKGTAAIRAFNFNDCGSSAWGDTLYVQVDTTLAINEPSETAVRVYPNPASNYMVFELQKAAQNGTITITDITGRPIASFPLTGEKTVWQTRGIPSGVYLYRIEEATALAPGKLVILNE
jgi:hypothetical protein